MPSLVLATRIISPFTRTFSRSLESKNICPKFLHLLHDLPITYNMYTIFSFVPALSAIPPLYESESKHVGSKGCVAC
jgi:hypothetical protein